MRRPAARSRAARARSRPASATGTPASSRPTINAAERAAAVDVESGRIRIEGSPARTSRMIPPRQAVSTPIAIAGSGASAESQALGGAEGWRKRRVRPQRQRNRSGFAEGDTGMSPRVRGPDAGKAAASRQTRIRCRDRRRRPPAALRSPHPGRARRRPCTQSMTTADGGIGRGRGNELQRKDARAGFAGTESVDRQSPRRSADRAYRRYRRGVQSLQQLRRLAPR